MGSLEDLEGRVSALESQMFGVRRDAAAARVLAGAADRDVSVLTTRLDAHQRLLVALRETQVEQGQRIERLETVVREGFATFATRQAEFASKQDQFSDQLDQVDGRLDQVDGRLDQVDGRLDRVDGRLDQVDGRLDRVEGGQERLAGQMDRLSAKQDELAVGQAQILDLLRRWNGRDGASSASAE